MQSWFVLFEMNFRSHSIQIRPMRTVVTAFDTRLFFENGRKPLVFRYFENLFARLWFD